jgi:multimeric flavodoxin WrbA
MRVLVITSNPKKKGALATLTSEAARGAEEAGVEVEVIRLAEMDIHYCKFCMNCYKDARALVGPCVQDDDMQAILEKIRAADGFVMATPLSSAHANACFKTFFERCTYTAGRPGRMLWIYGLPRSRFTDKKRYAVTIVTAGNMPNWMKPFCNVATRQMKELAARAFNASTIGSQYAGSLLSRGFKPAYKEEAYRLGRSLAETIAAGGQATP